MNNIDAIHEQMLEYFDGYDEEMEIQIRAFNLCGRFGQLVAGLVVALRKEGELK